MKRLLLATLLLMPLMCSVAAFGQTGAPVEFVYDSAGNRVVRRVIDMRVCPSGTETGDTANHEAPLSSARIRVYPNPTEGIVTMEPSSLYSDERCVAKVYDSKGRLLFESCAESGIVKIDLSGAPTGYYLVDLEVNDEHSSWKIIKR